MVICQNSLNKKEGIDKGTPYNHTFLLFLLKFYRFFFFFKSDIKGITIDGEEYLISQYADDITFTLNDLLSPRTVQ